MGILSSILSILDWGKDKIPLQDRIERWKNQIDDLTKEKNELAKEPATSKRSKRMVDIERELAHLSQLCKNKVD